MDLRYATDSTESAASLRAVLHLPISSGDASLAIQGGPVSLAQMGIAEGAAGILGVDAASFTGNAQLLLDHEGRSLVFDVEGAIRDVGLRSARLAPEDIHGVTGSFAARGMLSRDGLLRVDAARAAMGAAQIVGSGNIERHADSWAASIHLDVPPTDCNAAVSSLPAALVPALRGVSFGGSLAIGVRLAFDTRNLDALSLGLDVRDGCRATRVPEPLDRDHFRKAFEQRIVLPDGSTSTKLTGPGTADWTPLDAISPFMQIAVLTTEDGAFYSHRGYSPAAIRASIVANLKAGRFVRGASTLTMQLAKNLFLSRDKTLSRKIEELVLTDYLEQIFTKEELMELYLNVVELGPSIYGVTTAADYYFGRTPGELTLPEAFFLATLLPSPIRYSRMHERDTVPDGWMRNIDSLITIAHKRGNVTDADLEDATHEPIVFWHGGPRPAPRPPVPRRHIHGAADDLDLPAGDVEER